MRMKNLRSMIVLMIVLALALTIVAGCQTTPTTTAATTAATTVATTGTTAPTAVTLPLTPTKVTFKGFMVINQAENATDKKAVWDALSAKTNVYFDFENVLSSAAAERYTLMLASQQMPDITFTTFQTLYPGGMDLAIDDGVYMDIKALLPETMPAYWAKLNQPDVIRDVVTDKGRIGGIYQIQELYKDAPANIWGQIIRGDWLTDLNLEVPKTIADWTNVLTKFKTEKNAQYPLLWFLGNTSPFQNAYGILKSPFSITSGGDQNQFYPDANNQIKYGATETAYQDYLIQLSSWYKDGLFDRDFTTRGVYDLPTAAGLMGTGKAGANGGMLLWNGMYMAAAAGDPKFKIAVCPNVVLKAGEKATTIVDTPKYAVYPYAVSAKCANPKLLLQFFNYLTTDEGNRTINYGIEGVDYTMVNGKPVFTDKVLKNNMGAEPYIESITGNFQPFKLTFGDDITKQVTAPADLAAGDFQKDNVTVKFVSYELTPDEGQRFKEIFGDINTYVATEYTKAVQDPAIAATWNSVQAVQIKKMGIDEAIAILQGAWDRYMARK